MIFSAIILAILCLFLVIDLGFWVMEAGAPPSAAAEAIQAGGLRSLRRTFRLASLVAVIVQLLLLFTIGFVAPENSDAPSVAFAGTAFYAVHAAVLLVVAFATGWRTPWRWPLPTIRAGMVAIVLAALNLLFLRYWIDFDAEVRRTTTPPYVRSLIVGNVIIPLQLLLSLFNSAYVFVAASRVAKAAGDHSGTASSGDG